MNQKSPRKVAPLYTQDLWRKVDEDDEKQAEMIRCFFEAARLFATQDIDPQDESYQPYLAAQRAVIAEAVAEMPAPELAAVYEVARLLHLTPRPSEDWLQTYKEYLDRRVMKMVEV